MGRNKQIKYRKIDEKEKEQSKRTEKRKRKGRTKA
jgi:hypothetical protein